MGKYTNLYNQYQEKLAEANSRLRGIPKSAQAYQAFKSMRKELYSSKSRTMHFKQLSYPRNPKQAERMLKELKMMEKFTGYKSAQEVNRDIADVNRVNTFNLKSKVNDKENGIYSMDWETFVGWLENSKGFSFLAKYDSQRMMDLVNELEEKMNSGELSDTGMEWDSINSEEDLAAYLDDLVKTGKMNSRGIKYNVTDDPKLNKWLKQEKDKKIQEEVIDYLERLVSGWKSQN